jgi:hypothetical protein
MPLPGTALWLLLGLTVLAYANAFAGAFHFDDPAVLFGDPRLQSFSAFAAGVGETIRPFAKATFLLDRWLYGGHPAGYHALNLLLHLASGGLVYRILRHPSMKVASPAIAFWTALLFLLHPIATEAVTYISGRPTVLMTCGYLAAFLLFLEARAAAPGSSKQRVAVACASACLALSLLAKEVALVFPVLLVLYEAVIGRLRQQQPGAGGMLLRAHLPLTGVVFAFLAYAALHDRYAFLFRYSLHLRDGTTNLLTQANAVAYSLTLFARPALLNFDHDMPLTTSVLQGPTLLSIAVLAGLVVAALACARRAPLASFGILWFFLHLLPTNSVLPRYGVLSERNLYLPSIGLYLAVTAATVSLARWIGERRWFRAERWGSGRYARGAVRALQVALVAGLVALTAGRNVLYADPVAFWSDAVAKSPQKARPRTNLGRAYLAAGDLDQAMAQFRMALALDRLDRAAQESLLSTWELATRLHAPPSGSGAEPGGR